MNERIKQLAEQAQQYAEYTTPQGLEWLSAFKEKFAELIGLDMLKLANRHGNIKKHSINEYFRFEKDFGINTNNIKRFVNERTNCKSN